MPQEFQVLCCYKCGMFQVHHMKKAKKWQCKICNEKQSFKKVYKISSAPDCRSLCQTLNMQKGGVKFDDKTDSEGEADNSFTNEHLSAAIDADSITGFEDQSLPESEHENECFFDESRNVGATDNINLFSSTTTESNSRTLECFHGKFAQPAETAEFYRDINFKKSNVFDDNSFCKPVKLDNSKESHKHPLEIKTDISSQSHIFPPLKKKRGFEMIKNMEYFQGKISQNTETSKLNWNINFKPLDIFTKEKTSEAVDSIENKESYQSSFEIKANVPSQSLVICPVKKNRGFQMIKNAAAKLN